MAEPERLDAPNQQTVRPDASHPADEGDGAGEAPKAKRGPGRPPKAKSGDEPDPTTDDENGG